MEDNRILIEKVRVEKHLELYLTTKSNINYNDMLTLEYDGKSYYFRPTEVIINKEGITAIVKERGYWGDKLGRRKDVNYKDLLGLEVFVVTDENVIKRVDEESTYC